MPGTLADLLDALGNGVDGLGVSEPFGTLISSVFVGQTRALGDGLKDFQPLDNARGRGAGSSGRLVETLGLSLAVPDDPAKPMTCAC